MHLNNLSVAFAAESGIVPAISLIKRLLGNGPAERVVVFYGAEDGEQGDALEELLALKDTHLDRLSLSFVTSRDAEEAELLTGRLDASKVSALAAKLFDPNQVREYFVCGPRTLIDDVTGALNKIGVPAERIHADDSGAASDAAVKAGAGAAIPAATTTNALSGFAATEGSATRVVAGATQPASAPETRVALVLDGRRRTFSMLTGEENILDAAARAGIELPFSCKAGVCSTCRTKLVSGEVDMAQNYALEDWELEQGFILACQAHPKTPEIELTYDEK